MNISIAPRLPQAPRAASLATVVTLHVALVAVLLMMPPMRERIVAAQALMVQLQAETRITPPEPNPARPALQKPVNVTIPMPPIAIAPEVTIDPPAHRAPEMPVSIAPAPKAADAGPAIEPPRFDMSYLNNPAPAYPPVSRRLKEQGRVLLRVLVSAAGSAENVEVRASSGSERLDRAAVDAVRQWRFAPARRGAETLAAWALVPILFQLDT
ncbi:MAG: TonB family protein [Usitatibacter sp.]